VTVSSHCGGGGDGGGGDGAGVVGGDGLHVEYMLQSGSPVSVYHELGFDESAGKPCGCQLW
jgi:hypothetical protein